MMSMPSDPRLEPPTEAQDTPEQAEAMRAYKALRDDARATPDAKSRAWDRVVYLAEQEREAKRAKYDGK